MHDRDSHNSVSLVGKVTSAGKLRYTPSGIAVLEFTIAVEQSFLGTASRGRYDILAVGELGAGLEHKLRVGVPVKVAGQLWLREFRNRKGTAVKEVKIVGKSIAIVKPEPKIPASKQDENSAPRQ